MRSGKGFVLRAVLSFLALLFVFESNGFCRVSQPFNIFPDSSVSSSEGIFAPLVNPVFPDVTGAPAISYMAQSYLYNDACSHIFLMNLAGFSLSYTWFNNLYNQATGEAENIRTKYFRIGKGFFWNNTFGIGIDYSFSRSSRSDYDGYRSAALGILWRPFSFLSFGYTARDLYNTEFRGEAVRTSEAYSVSLRPYRDYITLSFDARRWEGEKFAKEDFLFSAAIHLMYDISIFASADPDKNFNCGLSVPLGAGPSSLIFEGYSMRRANGGRSATLAGVSIAGEKISSPLLQPERFLKIVFNKKIGEIEAEGLFKERGIIFYDILNAINKAGSDESIRGIIMQIDNLPLGIAQIQELREELKNFRAKQKEVYTILTTAGNKEYYLAAVSSRIYFTPSSYFSLSGLKAEVYFFKKLLEKAGIKFESVRKGKYKSFNETFTREHMSPEFRENLLELISDLNRQFLSDITEDRQISEETLVGLLNSGLIKPEEAMEKGFIDIIEYPEDAVKTILNNYRIPGLVVSLDNYLKERERLYTWGPVPEIAIIYVSGSIVRGESQGGNLISSEVIGDETYKKALYSAFKDRAVRAVIIRVDSPGGSAAASEFMWHYLIHLKGKYPDKPVIFSFGNTAASGGYFIASTGDQILGSRGTVTGSIGVISGKLSLKGLYEILGINKDIIKMSEFADIYSESKELSEAERAVLQKGVDFIYEKFTEKVVKYRGISEAELTKTAEGRVFTGRQAGRNRLIDNIGGLLAAVKLARARAGVTGYYEIRHLPSRKGPIMGLFEENISSSLKSEKMELLMQGLSGLDFSDEIALYYFPYRIVIK